MSLGAQGENIMGDPAAAAAAQTFVTETNTRLQNIDGIAGAFEIKNAALEIGISAHEDQRNRVETGITEALRQLQEVQEALRILNIDVISTIVDEKIKTANELQGRGSGGYDRDSTGFGFRGQILESKAINDLPELAEAKTYRDWSRSFKNAMEQIRPNVRAGLTFIEGLKESEVNEFRLSTSNDSQCTSIQVMKSQLCEQPRY